MPDRPGLIVHCYFFDGAGISNGFCQAFKYGFERIIRQVAAIGQALGKLHTQVQETIGKAIAAFSSIQIPP